MHAMVLQQIGQPLQWCELPDPQPGPGQIRIQVAACGVCRTDLHVVDGQLANPQVPIVAKTESKPNRHASVPIGSFKKKCPKIKNNGADV
jgi:NADPH:quinone reductase-like Zn-dependent oxidoreductase